jgi:hypothetical protein
VSGTPSVPVIVAADLAAGHDGAAEVLVGIRYPNGAERAVSLPCDIVDDAALAAGVATLAELVGRPWTVLTRTSAGAPNATPPTSPPPHHRSPEPGAP